MNVFARVMRSVFCLSPVLCVLFLPLLSASVLYSQQTADLERIELVAITQIPGDQEDKSNLDSLLEPEFQNQSEPVEHPVPSNKFGGISAMAHISGDRYYLLSDRGPLDGAVDWPCRVHEVKLEISDLQGSPRSAKSRFAIVDTILLKDKSGKTFTGLATATKATDDQTSRLDPEGIRIGPNGNLLVSDEYGPRLLEFTPEGVLVREFDCPDHLRIQVPGKTKAEENASNTTGRQGNRGMEGLALAGGNRLVGAMQSPLLQDTIPGEKGKPDGLNVRIPTFSVSGKFQGEQVYVLDAPGNKVNEILWAGDQRFILIERDGEAGVEAGFKKLIWIDARSATWIESPNSLPAMSLPESITPVAKTVLVDLLDTKWRIAKDSIPEKIEGLTFGPTLADGRKWLHVVSDNDFIQSSPTIIYSFLLPAGLVDVDSSNAEHEMSTDDAAVERRL